MRAGVLEICILKIRGGSNYLSCLNQQDYLTGMNKTLIVGVVIL